jgi:hypothetical protein
MVLNLKSTPMVARVDSVNLLSMNLTSREDLPTEDDPTMTILIYLSIYSITKIKST